MDQIENSYIFLHIISSLSYATNTLKLTHPITKQLTRPFAATVEDYRASIFALSTFCAIGDLKFAESAMHYLFFNSHMLDRHRELLYPAVKAFSQFDSLLSDRHRALTVSLATSGMELTDTLELKSDKPPHVLHLPSLPTKVFVYATGAGCATIQVVGRFRIFKTYFVLNFQGRTTYSTYSTNSNTSLLEISSEVIQEIQPDHSSVEEIEGKSPIIKIKTCFKWKGKSSSGILRMEVNLFSGFELTSLPPLLLNPQVNMTEMLHGFYDNNLWFVFANVSSECPVCIQYSIRSGYIVSSIRPAYARIYPVSREDLAADTFFHTPIGSSLLKDITEDDLFTWFRHNGTNTSEGDWKEDCLVSAPTVATTEASTQQVNTNTPNPVLKVENEDVVTYTINVEVESIKNLSKADESTTTTTILTTVKPNEKRNKTSGKPFKKQLPKKKQKKEDDEIFTTPKHVNTKKQGIPIKYLQMKDKEGEDEVTFAPEVKNDRYLLLDKEELWGMLREVVSDEISKKSKLS